MSATCVETVTVFPTPLVGAEINPVNPDKPQKASPAPTASKCKSICHAGLEQATRDTHTFFTEYWTFSTAKAQKKFVKQQTPSLSCLLFPLSQNDRLLPICKLITLVFLTDDAIDYMTMDDAFGYNGKIMQIMHGDRTPNPSIPFEMVMDDIANNFRAHDKDLAVEVLEATFELMRAQVDKQRLKTMDLQGYFDFREGDVGIAMLMSLIRFGMDLHLTKEEFQLVKSIEDNCSKHITTINDIYSYEKEVIAAMNGDEGAAMLNAVPIVMRIVDVDSRSAKRILWSMCREWEVRHFRMVEDVKKTNPSEALVAYLDAFEYLMAGNEVWSNNTLRYSDVLPA